MSQNAPDGSLLLEMVNFATIPEQSESPVVCSDKIKEKETRTQEDSSRLHPMNPFYDYDAASLRLEYLAQKRKTSKGTGTQLSRCTTTADWASAFQIVHSGSKLHIARATEGDKEASADPTEATFRIQGIICHRELPPLEQVNINKKDTKFLRQSISLTGLTTATFEESQKSIIAIYTFIGGYVDRSKMKPCSVCGNFEEYPTVEASNRFFTSVRDSESPMEQRIPFSKEVDPNGVLSKLSSSTYIHCESNVVDYLERIKDTSGKVRYESINPKRFQVGDIVEAEVSFMLVPSKGKLYQFVSVLRSIALFDNKLTRRAFEQETASTLATKRMKSVVCLKRKVEYDDDEDAGERQKRGRTFNAMEVDDSEDQTHPETGKIIFGDVNALQ